MSKMKNALEQAVERYCIYHYGITEDEAMNVIMNSEKDISWWRGFPGATLPKDARLVKHILVGVQDGRRSFDVAREINKKLEHDLTYQNGLIFINNLANKGQVAICIDVYDNGQFPIPEITI